LRKTWATPWRSLACPTAASTAVCCTDENASATLAISAIRAATGGAATGGASGPTSVALSLTFAGGYIALHNLVRRLDGLVVVSGNKVHATGPLLSISSVSLTGSPKLTVQLTATIYQLAAPAAATAATTGGQS